MLRIGGAEGRPLQLLNSGQGRVSPGTIHHSRIAAGLGVGCPTGSGAPGRCVGRQRLVEIRDHIYGRESVSSARSGSPILILILV